MKMELLRMENLEKNTSLNKAINDKWSFVPLLVVFFFFFLGICLRIQYVKIGANVVLI